MHARSSKICSFSSSSNFLLSSRCRQTPRCAGNSRRGHLGVNTSHNPACLLNAHASNFPRSPLLSPDSSEVQAIKNFKNIVGVNTFLHPTNPTPLLLRAIENVNPITLDSPFAHENLDYFHAPPCVWQSVLRIRQSTEAVERISRIFYVKARGSCGTALHRALYMAVAAGFGPCFHKVFRTSSSRTLSPSFQGTFWEPSMANTCWSSRARVAELILSTCRHGHSA